MAAFLIADKAQRITVPGVLREQNLQWNEPRFPLIQVGWTGRPSFAL